jgi:hypothetical protein
MARLQPIPARVESRILQRTPDTQLTLRERVLSRRENDLM